VATFNRVIDKIRIAEYRAASTENKAVFKGAKYLLLKNPENIRLQAHKDQLAQLLEINTVISTVMILKEQLKELWAYRCRDSAEKALDHWCELACTVAHADLNSFVKMLNRYRYGIINHCDYPIHTGKLEGVNNKIKVIKRKAYGYRDLRFFTLKIYQAFSN
jgi:transposase